MKNSTRSVQENSTEVDENARSCEFKNESRESMDCDGEKTYTDTVSAEYRIIRQTVEEESAGISTRTSKTTQPDRLAGRSFNDVRDVQLQFTR